MKRVLGWGVACLLCLTYATHLWSAPNSGQGMFGTLPLPVTAVNGGTGQSVYAIGDVLSANTTTTLSKVTDVAAGSYFRSGGLNTLPLWSTVTLPNTTTTGGIWQSTGTNIVGQLADVAVGSYLRSGGVGVAALYSTVTLPNTTTTGGIWQSTGTSVVGELADVAAGSYLRSGGVGVAALYSTVTLPNTTTTGGIWQSTGTNIVGQLADVAVGSYLRSGGVGVAALYSTVTLPNTTTTGGLWQSTGTSVVGELADVAVNSVLTSGGVGVVPLYSASPRVTAIGLGAAAPTSGVALVTAGTVGIASNILETFTTVGTGTASWSLTDTASGNTSSGNSLMKLTDSFTPASGSGNFAMLHLIPTINGTSSGKSSGLAVAQLTNTLTGGTINLADFGTTTTDYFTGFTSFWRVNVLGRVYIGGTATATTDWALTSGWGASATISAVTGNDSRGTVTVTTNALDTPTINPVITLTFKSLTWTTVPFCMSSINETQTGPMGAASCSATATALRLDYDGTPTALSSLTYVFNYMVEG